MSWKILPAIKDGDLYMGCLTCSTAEYKASMDKIICTGFGSACATKDGKTVYDGDQDYRNGNEPKTVGEIEKIAQESPDHDWRIVMYGPLHGEIYQRQGEKNWVCVESNQGFA
ncbi:hypothetical protein LCGC14_1394240 [marine sediment metagenome]|uniref:Uncharacterized protein n=1 Tax=marine sediment metagenome TaxID=412755 RepID=A0A0F9MEJ0_9ZZZZ